MTNPLIRYLGLPAARRGYVLEMIRVEERALLDAAAEETPDSDREVFIRGQAESLADVQALLEDVTKLSYEPPKFSVVPDPAVPFQHPVETAQTALVRIWVLCPKHERDAMVREFRDSNLGFPATKRTVYSALADYLEAIAEGLT